MQKIVIKNFGAIEYAEIEIKKVLVLIGEQASGKSTIAKLIYFFKTLKDRYELYKIIPEDIQAVYDDIDSDFVNSTKKKFRMFFGSTENLPNFEITFYYNFEKNKYLQLFLDESKEIIVRYINFSFENIKSELKEYAKLINELWIRDVNISRIPDVDRYNDYVRRFTKIMGKSFENYQVDSLFIIASRNCTISYSELFDRYLRKIVKTRIRENQWKNIPAADEILTLIFIEKIAIIKNRFMFSGNNSFEFFLEIPDSDKSLQEKLQKAFDKISIILKGKYIIDNQEEKIILNEENQRYLHLRSLSSGQQESIRILQDTFLNIYDYNLATLRVLEEPEAHLFPVAQKHLVELLAMMVNHNDNNQLIITTHSPYILSVFNNLLFAQRVVEKNPPVKSEVAEIIPEDYWLNAAEFSVYSLGNQFLDEEANYCESILDNSTGMIAQNYLDTVSEMLGGDFNELYRLHARTFKRK